MTADLEAINKMARLLLARKPEEAQALARSRPDLGDEAYGRAYGLYITMRDAKRPPKPQRSDEEWLRDVLSEDQPKRRGGRPRRATKKEPRIKWRYFPFPSAIWDDPKLSEHARSAAGAIARSVNLGPWNTDLHADVTYDKFRLGSRLTAWRAAKELKDAGYIESESLNRGGVRYKFTEKAYGESLG